MRKSCDWYGRLYGDLRRCLRNRSVPDVADLAMLLVGCLGVPVAGRIRTQGGDRQDKADSQ